MSIFEYDEEKVLKIIGNEKFEAGKVSGHVDLIANFFRKNCTSEEIAERLDMDISYVQTIIGLIKKYPNETSIEIANRMLDNTMV